VDQAGSVLCVGEEGEGSEGGNERNEGDGRKRRKGKERQGRVFEGFSKGTTPYLAAITL